MEVIFLFKSPAPLPRLPPLGPEMLLLRSGVFLVMPCGPYFANLPWKLILDSTNARSLDPGGLEAERGDI